jgi:hypothetical protein
MPSNRGGNGPGFLPSAIGLWFWTLDKRRPVRLFFQSSVDPERLADYESGEMRRLDKRTSRRLIIVGCIYVLHTMQPPPLLEPLKVSYRVPRDVLVRIWWRRMFVRPRILGAMTAMLAVAIFCFFARGRMEYAGLVLVLFLAMTPINIYRAVAKAVDGNSQYTDPKTVEFSSERLVVVGPNWKSDLPWTTFRGFSEDATYFYLHLSDNGLASVIPKSSFTGDSQAKFREYATARYT